MKQILLLMFLAITITGFSQQDSVKVYPEPCKLIAFLALSGTENFKGIIGNKQENIPQDKSYMMHRITEHFGSTVGLKYFSNARIRKVNWDGIPASYSFIAMEHYDERSEAQLILLTMVAQVNNCSFKDWKFTAENITSETGWWVLNDVKGSDGKVYPYRVGLKLEASVEKGWYLVFSFTPIE